MKVANSNCFASLLLMIIIFFTSAPDGLAQDQDDLIISFSVQNTTLDLALESLFEDYQVKVAFSKAELSEIEIKEYGAVQKPVSVVLSDLLLGTGFEYKKIGNQFVVVKMKVPVAEEIALAPDTIVEQTNQLMEDDQLEIHVDTVVLEKTIIRVDTLIQMDTLLIRDTVIYHDTLFNRYDAFGRLRSSSDSLPFSISRDGKLSLTFSFAQKYLFFENVVLADGFDPIYVDAVTPQAFGNFAFGIDGGYSVRNWCFGMGLSYASYKNKVMFDHLFLTGDYYITDTVESYYVINQQTSDTSYYYLMDSTYVPISEQMNSYSETNKMNYLELDIFATYNFFTNDRFSTYLRVGASFNFLIYSSGILVGNTMEQPTLKLEDYINKTNYALFGGLGVRYALLPNCDIMAELNYKRYLKSIYTDSYSVAAKPNLVGIKLGLSYYF